MKTTSVNLRFIFSILLSSLLANTAIANSNLFDPYIYIHNSFDISSLAVTDINNDGRNDVIAGRYYPHFGLRTYLQNENGALEEPTSYTTQLDYPFDYYPESIATGDFNNDGLNDVAVGVANIDFIDFYIEIFLQTPEGALSSSAIYPSSHIWNLRSGDFNNDGLTDLASTDWRRNDVSVYLQNTTGLFSSPQMHNASHDYINDIVVGDINNDGLTDILTITNDSGTSNLGAFIQTVSGSLEPIVYYGHEANAVTIGDFNNDSFNDIAMIQPRPESRIHILFQHPISPSQMSIPYSSPYGVPEILQARDVNNDNLIDLVVLDGGESSVGVYLQQTNEELTPLELYPVPILDFLTNKLVVADINSDGFNDLVTSVPESGLSISTNTAQNYIPVAIAGEDATYPPNILASIDGGGSYSANGSIINYQWTQLSGPIVGGAAVTPYLIHFTTPEIKGEPGTSVPLVFELTVTDNKNRTSSDQVTINVLTVPNQAPIADAGINQTVDPVTFTQLNASASVDYDGMIVSYQWIQIQGPAVELLDSETALPRFYTPGIIGNIGDSNDLVFQLTVTDDYGDSSTDTVAITVPVIPNQDPIANAGADQTVSANTNVTLDGSASSDPEFAIASYTWLQIGGASVSLTNANTASASFIAPEIKGEPDTSISLVFELTVTDDHGGSNSDQVTINVLTVPNQPPIANAGYDQSVAANTNVILNGTASVDQDGSIVSYAWNQASGPAVTIIDANSSTASFVAPEIKGEPGTSNAFTFNLTVTDDNGDTNTDQIIVNVATVPNQPPVANAGADQNVTANTNVTLNGSASIDNDGSIVSYTWSQTDGPAVTLTNSNTSLASFIAPEIKGEPGTSNAFVFNLLVIDDNGDTNSDQVIVNVTTVPNQPPMANAGENQLIKATSTTTLDGRASVDNDGAIISYSWQQLSGPNVTLNSTGIPGVVSFTTYKIRGPKGSIQNYIFELTVTDDNGDTATDLVVVSAYK